MRIKTIHAPTMPEALRKIRTILGEEAIMVSSRKTIKGIEVTAAADPKQMPIQIKKQKLPINPKTLLSEYGETKREVESTLDIINNICSACDYHRIPKILRDRWLDNIRNLMDDQGIAIDRSLEEIAPLNKAWIRSITPEKPVILIGPPGAGKTVSTAKITAQLLAAGRKVRVITCDTIKAGAVEQTRSYLKAMRQKLYIAKTRMELREFTQLKQADEIIVIDTPGMNIFDDIDRMRMRDVLALLKAEPTLVLPAHLDAMAAAELAYQYSSFQASELIITQLDTTRHYGSLLTAPVGGDMKLVGVADGPEIGTGIHSINHKILSSLLQYTPENGAGDVH